MNKNKPINVHPLLKANFLSKLFFWWLKPLLNIKKRKNFDKKDLYKMMHESSSKFLGDSLENAWFEELKYSRSNKRKPSLLKAIYRTFCLSFWYYGIHVFIICVVLRGLQPYVLGLLIRHFDYRSNSTTGEAYIYATAFVATIIFQAIIGHHSVVGRKEVGMRMSVACSALIYRKMLRLSISASNEYDIGKTINLLSSDVTKFEDVCMFLHYIWVLPIQGVLMAYFMWDSVGIASLAGVCILFIQTIPVQGYLAKITAKIRTNVSNKTDKRIRLMSEIVSSMRFIKMYAWEKSLQHLVSQIRREELEAIGSRSRARAFSMASSTFAESTSLLLAILVHGLLLSQGPLTAGASYSLVQYFGMLKIMVTVFYPRAVAAAAEVRVAVRRIEVSQFKRCQFIFEADFHTVN